MPGPLSGGHRGVTSRADIWRGLSQPPGLGNVCSNRHSGDYLDMMGGGGYTVLALGRVGHVSLAA